MQKSTHRLCYRVLAGMLSLVCLFCENRGIVLTRSQLMDRVWGLEAEHENRTLDVHIRTLRSKLKDAGAYIETVRGIGYRMIGDKNDR